MIVIYWLMIGALAGIFHLIRVSKFDISEIEKIDYYVAIFYFLCGPVGFIAFIATGMLARFVRGEEFYEDN